MKKVVASIVTLVLGLTMLTASGAAAAPRADISLNSVGAKYVNQSFSLVGYVGDTPRGKKAVIVHKKKVGDSTWIKTKRKVVKKTDGRIVIPRQKMAREGTFVFRVTLKQRGKVLDRDRIRVSAVARSVAVPPAPQPPAPPAPQPPEPPEPPAPPRPPQPDPVVAERWVEGEPDCVLLRVPRYHQKRTNTWTWNGTEWVEKWGAWMTHHQEFRQAGVDDCIQDETGNIPDDVLLPDIQIKNLDKCGRGDLDISGGDCFYIVNPGPYVSDYPHLEGRKLLKFPVLTMNVGDGPAEVVADRSAVEADDWVAYQNFYDPDGDRHSEVIPEVEFYFAGDGHNHWHFRDFDYYWMENLDGEEVGTAEKHGYCIYDNTSYGPFRGLPGVPANPVYLYEETCGEGLPNALTIIHGLSKGWGDTYPSTLPDQLIDITGLPDGRYKVGVHADALGAVREKNEGNNVATMEITISGDEVITHPETAAGGLP